MRNVRLTVAYDGTDFHGFAMNGELRTVMGELRAAVARVVRRPVELTGAGRTDAGVHGWGQVVTGLDPRRHRPRPPAAQPQRSVPARHRRPRRSSGPSPDFSARFSATSRRYRYDIWNEPQPNPFIARIAWHVPSPLDVAAMNVGVAPR